MPIEQTEVQAKIMQVLDTITEEWDDDLDEEVTLTSKLVEDVGFASIDFVQFAVAIESEFKQKLGFQALLMQDGAYVDDLSLQQVVDFVFARLNADPVAEAPVPNAAPKESNVQRIESVEDPVTAEMVAEFRKIIRPCAPHSAPSKKNKPAVFILSPPRSGSTLLRIMLAGCPELFVPPELHLLSYVDMKERLAALDDEHNRHLLEGTIRALMQLKNWSGEEARKFSKACEENGMSCQAFYNILQIAAGDRLLVDKTPTYAVNLDILKNAENDFENAKYIHLQRHPCGTIRSYEESKLTRMMPLMKDSEFSSRALAEMTWLTCHQNTLKFAEQVPSDRILAVQYENLVKQPEVEMRRVCEFLGVEFNPEMLNPYKDQDQRMTDGVDVASKMSGDLKFHLHQNIDPTAADRWRQFYSEEILGDVTKDVAKRCGYDI